MIMMYQCRFIFSLKKKKKSTIPVSDVEIGRGYAWVEAGAI